MARGHGTPKELRIIIVTTSLYILYLSGKLYNGAQFIID